MKSESPYAQEQLLRKGALPEKGLSGPVKGTVVSWEMVLKILQRTIILPSLVSI
jgi:hypothetical protein